MPERLRSIDAAWLRMDRAENAADIVALLRFREPLPFARLAEVVERRLLPLERFRQRVEPAGLGAATWEPDGAFSLDRHLHRAALPADGQAALQAFVGEVATERLDPAHPLWKLWSVEGFGTGSAVVAKLHHCIGDGFALVSVLLQLADPGEGGAFAFPALPYPELSLGSALRDLGQARRFLRLGAGLTASVARLVALRPDPPTPLGRPLSGRRRTAWSAAFPLPSVRQAARGLGATVNDLLLAALAGALRGHLAEAGVAVDGLRLRALMPVNLRIRAQDGMGNGFGLVFVELPVGLATASERLLAVRRETAARKASPEAGATYRVLSLLGRLPGPVEALVNRFFTGKASLVVTNVPGPRESLAVAGRRLDELMFWVPHPSRLGLGVSILTYAGEVRVGVRCDVAVMPDPADLVARFEAELAAPHPG